ncbi:unnamed protein product [Cuscuta epithymum]|uniref:Uncharacterized protein n=1 Tax=Cuscuta epithymum TaxID=186058 RepID=A0AAV0DPL0_9ASTE|nr:unnamed protein product [Cuscuta epithymum]
MSEGHWILRGFSVEMSTIQTVLNFHSWKIAPAFTQWIGRRFYLKDIRLLLVFLSSYIYHCITNTVFISLYLNFLA